MAEPPSGADPPAKPEGRVLGLDLGDVRIGVAVSDPDRRLAVPVGTVRTGAPQDLKAIAALVRDHDISLVVVGHPLSMSGRAGPKARHVEELVGALRSFLSVPVVLQDERLSTVEAERNLREAGIRGRDRRRAVDRSAATVILQAWLDAHKSAG
ncbi:MAG: Holliday junction resolvase RuvX [Actinomycetota bacterium]